MVCICCIMVGDDIKMNKNQKLYIPLSIGGKDIQDAKPIKEELIIQG